MPYWLKSSTFANKYLLDGVLGAAKKHIRQDFLRRNIDVVFSGVDKNIIGNIDVSLHLGHLR